VIRRLSASAVCLSLLFAGCQPASTPPPRASSELASSKAPAESAAPAELPPAPGLDGPLLPLPAPEERITVPDFDGATQWLNVDRPLTLADLKGRVVVVDFWTSCCINCLQTLPTLKRLEEAFRGAPVVVVGVHSPKFDEEADAERLVDIVLDNRIEHPVASDANMRVWRAWGVEAWPTIAVLDQNGKAVWAGAGEPDYEELSGIVRSLVKDAHSRGELARGELPRLRPEKETAGVLRYPGKVVGLENGGMAIADTGHNRVLLTDKDGKITDVVGSGAQGKDDGDFAKATFSRPQGMAEALGDLYVADMQNHMIRKIDRKAKTVTTVAGTGELGGYFRSNAVRPGLSVALRSPWDLLTVGEFIFVALAGSHQIALFLPKTNEIRLFAGSGREARQDGPLLDAAFAQPSALAYGKAKKELYVLDSETSSVRAIDVEKKVVRTVVGKGLFDFGDVDGDKETTRFQHPIGMAFADGALFVADSYNSKIKRVDPVTGATRSLLGGRDDKVLDEPAGLTVLGTDLIVADTNHHRLLRVPNRGTGAPEPLTLSGVK
jgi:thiol-disulfide isomerase/thioredoxin